MSAVQKPPGRSGGSGGRTAELRLYGFQLSRELGADWAADHSIADEDRLNEEVILTNAWHNQCMDRAAQRIAESRRSVQLTTCGACDGKRVCMQHWWRWSCWGFDFCGHD